MAAYPTFEYDPSRSSAEEVLDDLQMDRASNGTAKGRALYTAPKRRFVIVHEGLLSADKTTLLDFYTTNRLLEIDFLWVADGVTYTCIFTAPPKPVITGMRWTVTTFMEQV